MANSGSMPDTDPKSESGQRSLFDRRVQRIANARSVTLGLAATFLVLAFVGAAVIQIVDGDNFPSYGTAVWWALQTVTTVGYGDIVPTTGVGRVVAGVEMVLGVSFIAFLTAGVTSVVLQRGQTRAEEAERARRDRDHQAILDGLAQVRAAITDLDNRLDDTSERS